MVSRPPSGHGVAGIERQVQDRALHLGRVGQGVPQAAGDDRLHLHRLAQACGAAARPCRSPAATRLTTFGSSGWRRAKASSWRVSWAARSAPCRAFFSRCAAALVAGHLRGHQLEVAADHLQEVVEVVGDAAGEMAHRLHALGRRSRSSACSRSVMSRDEPTIRSVPAVVVAHRRQDRLPDARAAGQRQAVAAVHRLGAGDHTPVVGRAGPRRRGLGPERSSPGRGWRW